jgi:hypothetical protein
MLRLLKELRAMLCVAKKRKADYCLPAHSTMRLSMLVDRIAWMTSGW